MTSPTVHPDSAVVSASQPNLRRPAAQRAALPAHPAVQSNDSTGTSWLTGQAG